MLTVSGKRRSMYLCSSDVLPTFMSPKSTIFPSGFFIFPLEVPLPLRARVRPARPGRSWGRRPPPPGPTRTRDSRGVAETFPSRRPGARKRKRVSGPGRAPGAQGGAPLQRPDRSGLCPSGAPAPGRPRPRPAPPRRSPRPPLDPAPPRPPGPGPSPGTRPFRRAGRPLPGAAGPRGEADKVPGRLAPASRSCRTGTESPGS